MMQAFDTVSIDDLVALPPTIFGTIRWKKYIGRPLGDLCSGFNIRVEEHTATQFRAVGGGKYEPIPGTGIWNRANPVAVVFLGYRTIEPKSASVVLKNDNHIQSVEFEVVQRPRPWRAILSAAVAGAIVGSVLQRGRPSTSLAR